MTSGPELRRRLLDPAKVVDGSSFRLDDHDPGERSGLDKSEGRKLLADAKTRLRLLQRRLAAQGDWSVLVILQAMDAGGKDGTIRHVMSGMNPQGVQVTSFKQPGPEALSHDFLWRVHQAVPPRGAIGVFNRSHYEEVLVCRVHPDLIGKQNLPESLAGEGIWRRRFADIVAFETYLANQGIVPLKFFLNISRDEQRDRLLARLDHPEKNWKFSPSDLAERTRWGDYRSAYQDAIAGTATEAAPWYVVPADHKWHARLVVIEALVEALKRIDPHPPSASIDIEAARLALSQD